MLYVVDSKKINSHYKRTRQSTNNCRSTWDVVDITNIIDFLQRKGHIANNSFNTRFPRQHSSLIHGSKIYNHLDNVDSLLNARHIAANEIFALHLQKNW